MKHAILLPAALLAVLLAGTAPAFAEEEWKVMTPVQQPAGTAQDAAPTSLESAAEAALPPAGGGAGTAAGVGLSSAAAAALAEEAPAEEKVVGAAPAEEAPAAQAEAPAPAKPAAQPKAEKPAGPAYLAEDQPFQLKDYEEPKKQAAAPWWQTLLGLVFKLAIVLGLIYGSMVAVKKMSGGKLPGGLSIGAKGRNLVVLESTALGPQGAMHLVSIGGGRLIVIGTGPQGPQTLATIDDPQQVQVLLAASRGQTTTGFGHAYDMESVVQEPGNEIFRGALQDVSRRGGWEG